MKKLCVFFVLALAANVSLGMNLRHKRQSTDENGDLDDRYGWNRPDRFPNPFLNLFPNQGQQQQQHTTQRPSRATLSPALQQCLNRCVAGATQEYSPVCGSDNVTYFNPSRLTCAQSCGVAVTQVRQAPCPLSNPIPQLASNG